MNTNVVAYLLLPGPQTSAAEALLEAEPEWSAPPLWRCKWRNVHNGYQQRGAVSRDQVIALQHHTETLVITQG